MTTTEKAAETRKRHREVADLRKIEEERVNALARQALIEVLESCSTTASEKLKAVELLSGR